MSLSSTLRGAQCSLQGWAGSRSVDMRRMRESRSAPSRAAVPRKSGDSKQLCLIISRNSLSGTARSVADAESVAEHVCSLDASTATFAPAARGVSTGSASTSESYTRPSTDEELDSLLHQQFNRLSEFERPSSCDLPALRTVTPGPMFRAHCPGCVAVSTQFRWRFSEKYGSASAMTLGHSINRSQDAAWGGTKGIELERGPSGNFVASLTMVPGHYTYKYKVDGQWRVSLREAVVTQGHNQNNSVTVADTVTYRWQPSWGGEEVYVVGSESNWLERYKLEQVDGVGDYILRKSLPVGTYQYKFIVDGRWRVSPEETAVRDSKGEVNNQVTVAADATVTIFYKTGWTNPRMLVVDTTQPNALPLTLPKPKAPAPGAKPGAEVAMEPSPYPEVPFSVLPRGLWKTVSLPAFAASLGSEKPALEFVIAEGSGLYDLAPGKGTYKCPWPGGYKLENGRLTAFPRAKTPPIMLVSDLDGTMVGSTPEFDAATKSFKRYWDDTASLAGSVLVYSTGRSIGQVMSLFKEKGGALAVPDAIVTAVGTKIFFRESGAEGEWCWREDEAWKAQLDKGWDLVPVKAACQAVIQAHDGRVQWLDQGTEHPHRVAVSCAVEAVEAVQARLAALFASADVEVKIIVSGEGAWRYVDCVAFRGGKQESLEYLRKHYGMPLERTVAAGDSGNDVLMLGGKHQALIVGNCQPDLLKWHLLQPQTGRCVLTDAHGAMGILEGLARFQLY